MKNSISKLKETLTPLYDQREVKAIISLLMEEVCAITRVDMIMEPDRKLPPGQAETLSRYASQLAQGIPVQHVLGYEYFCGRKFEVNRDVLIPRPETAELVDWIVSAHSSPLTAHRPLHILDIGTGSGCIAITLAALINNSQVVGADLSTAALTTARRNAEALKISNVGFVQMDILADGDESYPQPDVDKFDIIVSNPPYIMDKEKTAMSANVLDHEPHLALFVPDDDPLLFYRAIARYGRRRLRKGGRLYFEINAALGTETCALLQAMGYSGIEMRKDINGRNRMITAQYDTDDI